MKDNICWIRKRFATIVLALVLALSSVSVFSAIYSTQTVEAATVKLNKTRRTMKVGQVYKLTVKGPHGTVKWKSSKSSVAAVDNSGVVKAKKKGTANIYAQVGKKKLKCRITVKNPAPSLNKKSLTLYRGGTFRLAVKYPTSKVKWSSSNKSVATVNATGTVVAKKNGKATITAAMRGRKLRCSVVVKSATAPSTPVPSTPAPSTPAPSTPAPSSNPVANTPGSTSTPAGGNGNAGTSSGGTTTPSQPSTEHTHDWKLDGDIPITYYCGKPLRYVCTACGQFFRNKEDLLKHDDIIVPNSNLAGAKIYAGVVRYDGDYDPSVKPNDGSIQFFAMGTPVHAFFHAGEGARIYNYPGDVLKIRGIGYSSFTGTDQYENPSNESYNNVHWDDSSPADMVVCSCGAVFANQRFLDMHIHLVNDLNAKLAASMGTTPYLHHKKGTGVECGICRVSHGRYYTCTTCGANKFQPDNDYPKSKYPQ